MNHYLRTARRLAGLSLAATALCLVAGCGPRRYELRRAFHAGERITEDQVLQTKGPVPATGRFRAVSVVGKIYPDGSADVTTTLTLLSVLSGGQTRPSLNPPSTFTRRATPFGGQFTRRTKAPYVPTQAEIEAFGAAKGGLSVGETLPFELSDPVAPDRRAKGTITLRSVTEGVATLDYAFDVLDAGGAGKPPHIEGEDRFDLATGRLVHSDRHASSMPGTLPEFEDSDDETFG